MSKNDNLNEQMQLHLQHLHLLSVLLRDTRDRNDGIKNICSEVICSLIIFKHIYPLFTMMYEQYPTLI